jgi:hypothetical protein
MSLVLGVDLGGSRLRAALRSDGKRIRRFARPRPSRADLPAEIRGMLRGRKLDGLVIGARGVWTPAEKKALAAALRRVSRRVLVLSDVELAWRAALGGKAGIVVVAGTGSIAYGRAPNGRSARSGGLGPLLGDEGSGFWIGKRWLASRPETTRRRFAARPDAVRAIAGLARKALQQQPALAREAAKGLAELAKRCAAELGMKKNVACSWHGGLFAHAGLRRRFVRELGGNFRAVSPLEPAEEAASKLLL